MSEKNTWYEAYSRTGVELPEVKWNTAYRPHVEQPVAQPQATRTLTSSDIYGLIQKFVSGTEDQMVEAAGMLIAYKPQEANNLLFQVANGSKTKDSDRRKAAILTLARMTNPNTAQATAQGIINLPKAVELNATVCMALGIIRSPVGLPHLYKILRDGIGIAVFNKYSVEQQKVLAIYTRAYALLAIGMIGNRESIAPLVLEVEREFFCQDYSDDSNNALSNSTNIGLAFLGVAASIYGDKRKNARVAACMVDPDVGLSTVLDFPAEAKRGWMLQHRINILKSLCSIHGIEPFKALLPQAKHSFQRLYISLPITQLGNTDSIYVNPMAESTRSSGKIERLLAYDGLIKIYSLSKNPQFESWALAGLNDKDSIVRTATAASLLYNRAGKLMGNALALTQDKSVDVRMSILPPLMGLAI